MPLKLPPFGRQLTTRIKRGDMPSNGIWIYCGSDAWARAAWDAENLHSRGVLMLPANEDPSKLRWPVKGIPCVIVVDTGISKQILHSLGSELIRAGSPFAVATGPGTRNAFGVSPITFAPRKRAA